MGGRGIEGAALRVLVVDDDPRQLAACTRLLRTRHCEVTTARSPVEAEEKLRIQSFDLVLSDQRLPDMSGTELLAEARRLQSSARRVVMSAFSEPPEILAAIQSGDVHRFVTKPIQADQLLRELGETTDTVRCLVIDPDEERAERLGAILSEEKSLAVTCAAEANGVPADLVIFNASGSAQATGEMGASLRGHFRDACIMAALSPRDLAADVGALPGEVDDALWLPIDAREVRLRYQTWQSRRSRDREPAAPPQLPDDGLIPNIVGRSEPMRSVFHQIQRVASSDASVLIQGETGTGKELMARALHDLSLRRAAPFLAVNLSAIPESLVEGELFGHERGAFTGARNSRQGRVEAADGGTLFLDEVGDLSANVQVKLLRVLEQRTFERLGSTKSRRADFRLICATHRDLEQKVADGTFREDLYYRINVVHLELPPLRERGEDVHLLSEYFLNQFCEKYRLEGISLGEGAKEALARFNWPGNVRQLQHVIERAVAMSRSGDTIEEKRLWGRPPRETFRSKVEAGLSKGRGLREVLADIERTMLVEALERHNGNQRAAAEKLKIPRQTLQNRLKKYGL